MITCKECKYWSKNISLRKIKKDFSDIYSDIEYIIDPQKYWDDEDEEDMKHYSKFGLCSISGSEQHEIIATYWAAMGFISCKENFGCNQGEK